ncbi:MAG: hypothetical protein K1Y36_14410 [Blastocatellia bacterium]|nr:hypothetical protein [Blastocatellia bacterium]
MAKTIDEQLTDLEDEIRKLKIEFDIYFNGGTKRPPYDSKNRVEAIIKRIGDDRTMRFGTRFRYNQIVSRYTAFRELWRRHLQEREEGRDARSQYEAAANERARTIADRVAQAEAIQDQAFDLDLDNAFSNIHTEQPRAVFKPTKVTFADPKQEEEGIRRLYQSVIAAKIQCGESIDNTSFEQFQKMIIFNTNKLKAQRQAEEISFSVDVEDGKVKFKAQ